MASTICKARPQQSSLEEAKLPHLPGGPPALPSGSQFLYSDAHTSIIPTVFLFMENEALVPKLSYMQVCLTFQKNIKFHINLSSCVTGKELERSLGHHKVSGLQCQQILLLRQQCPGLTGIVDTVGLGS